MKEVRIGAIPTREVLHFLGWRGSPVEAELIAQIESLCREIDASIRAGVIVRSFPYDQKEVSGTRFLPQGRDVRSMLEGCSRIVLMAVTLGAESERMLLREQARGAYEAMLMDAAMSAAVEHVCDQEETALREEAEGQGLYLTDRFSPGYGDMPVTQNGEILAVLGADLRIGLMTTRDGLMIPRKSVAAVLGVSPGRKPHRRAGCSVCAMRDRCMLRKTE